RVGGGEAAAVAWGGSGSWSSQGGQPLSAFGGGGAQKCAPAAAREQCDSVALDDQRPPRRSCNGCPPPGIPFLYSLLEHCELFSVCHLRPLFCPRAYTR